jgi:hypothetical protein
MEQSLASILRDTYYQSFVPVLNELRDKYMPPQGDAPQTEMATEEMMSFTIGLIMGLIQNFGGKMFVDDLQMRTNVLTSYVSSAPKIGDIPESEMFLRDIAMLAMAGIQSDDLTSIGCDELFPLYASFTVLVLCVWDIGQLST